MSSDGETEKGNGETISAVIQFNNNTTCKLLQPQIKEKRPAGAAPTDREGGTELKEEYVWGFCRMGPDCGRDATGTYHCVCGKCVPLRVHVGKGGKYRGDDSGDGRYAGEEHVEVVSSFGTLCL